MRNLFPVVWLLIICSLSAHAIPRNPNGLAVEYGYYVESLPQPGWNIKGKLVKAMLNWSRVCGVIFFQSRKRETSFIIRTARIDGEGGKLVDYQAGVFTLDSDENWDSITEYQFERAATHEFGHIVGLSDTATNGQIMNEEEDSVTTPQTEDIERAVAIWGPTRFQRPGKQPRVL